MGKIIKEIVTSDTIIGRDSEFEGNIKFFGNLDIKGSVKGNISGEGTVTIEPEASLESNIHASHIIIYGTICGQVSAEINVHIHASGKIYGDINAPDIEIEKGALIKGKCHIHKINIPNEPEQAIVFKIFSE